MKHITSVIITLILLFLSIEMTLHTIKITNLERQLLRIEQEYQAAITENRKLRRLNETNLRLMSHGGWDGYSPTYSISTTD